MIARFHAPRLRPRATARPALRWILCVFLACLLVAGFGYTFLGPGGGVSSAASGEPRTLSGSQEDPTPTLAPNTGAIAGQGWQDLNANGLLEAGEPPLAGLLVTLYRQGGPVLATAMTGDNGRYRLDAVEPGFYRLTATPPAGYQLTTLDTVSVYVSSGSVLAFDFGAQFIPTPTATATPLPQLDTEDAPIAWCGGVIQASTAGAANNVSNYACRAHWQENGPELVYRVELGRSQTLTASFISATADLDLFLLRTSYPESCVAAGDNLLSYAASPGQYYLVVDGYEGATGSFAIKLECPLEVQATATPRPTASPTPTATMTYTPGPTPTATPTGVPQDLYLPLMLRNWRDVTLPSTTLVLQEGTEGYAGTADTTLSAWEPVTGKGAAELLSLRYNQQTAQTTHMAPLLRFDLDFLPKSAEVVQATLQLYAAQIERPQDIRGEARGLLAAWGEEAATWEQRLPGVQWNQVGAQAIGQDCMNWVDDSQLIDGIDRWFTFDITDLVRLWTTPGESNYGLILLAQPGFSQSNLQVDFASSEHHVVNLRPKLTVTYRVTANTSGEE